MYRQVESFTSKHHGSNHLYAPNLKEKPKNCKLLIESEVGILN